MQEKQMRNGKILEKLCYSAVVAGNDAISRKMIGPTQPKQKGTNWISKPQQPMYSNK